MQDPSTRKHSVHARCLWSVHVGDALKRGMISLGIDDYISKTQDSCVYCGCLPSNPTKFRGPGSFLYNGVDRIDNMIGYTLENTVTACKLCNSMKSSRDGDVFLNHVLAITKHMITKGLVNNDLHVV